MTGLCRPQDVRRNADAQPGDALILTKALGVGIYCAAFKQGALGAQSYAEMIGSMTVLNRIGADLAKDPAVHAITDVTGFGLLGPALEMTRSSKVTLTLYDRDLPLLSQAAALAQKGFVTGASGRNWTSYGEDVELPDGFPEWRRSVLTDPQTSGGLLIACGRARATDLVQGIIRAGYPQARIVGYAEASGSSVRIAL